MTSIAPAPTLADITAGLAADGYLVLPAFAEPHAHLDKAFLAERVPNPTGDLMGAILAMGNARPSITVADTTARAERAARLMAANGTTAIRTHADVTADNGLISVEALIDVRERLRDLVDIQIVALAGYPSTGAHGDRVRGLLRDAIEMGIDVIGGCPHLETDPAEANDLFLTFAASAGLPVDLHTDETLNPAICALADLAERVLATGFSLPVTASHCCSLGVQPEARQRSIAERVAAAGIHVVALPQTNLFLQGRQHGQSTPRGITAVRALLDAGVHVAAGADNLQDPFNPVGRGDALETASLMVTAAHLLPDEAMAAVSTEARHVLGVPAAGDLVAVRAETVREAIAFGPADRIVVRHGVVVAGRTAAG
ncbi:MAG: amidohydrolase family protein [Ilumatobacteraceae bacterium]